MQHIEFSLSRLPSHCKMVFLFVCCYPGDEFSYLDQFHCSIETKTTQQCLYDVDEHVPTTNHSNSLVLCRFLRKESGERQWELMSIFSKCDPGYRFQDVILEYIGDSFPIQLKQNTVQLKKKWKYQLQLQHFQQQNLQYLIPILQFPVAKESFVLQSTCKGVYMLQWGCDWQQQPQEDVMKFPLEVQTILYGQYGSKYDVVDRTHRMSRDHSVTLSQEDQICVMKLDLTQVAPHVKCIIVVMVAPQSGFSKLVHAYLRMFQYQQQKEVEWYRSGNLMDYVDYRISMNIAFKLTRMTNNEWQFHGIHQPSVATSAFHQALEQELEPWIDKDPIPPCIPLTSALELCNDAIVIDLNCTTHSAPQFILESVHIAQFNEYGKETLSTKTFSNSKYMNLKIANQSHCNRPRDVTLDLNEMTLNEIHTVMVLASVVVDANNVINANSIIQPISTTDLNVYLTDKDEKNQICSLSLDYMAKTQSPQLQTYCMLLLKRQSNNRWKVEFNNSKIAPSDRVESLQGNVSALKFVRCIRHLLDKELIFLTSHQVFQGESCHIKQYDAKNIVLGFGMEQSLLESIQCKPRIKVAVELYDSFTTLQQVLDHSVDGMQYYHQDQLYMQTSNDEVQVTMNRVAFSHFKYRVFKMEVKSRRLIQSNDQFYCRVCDSTNGREICRILMPASLFLKGYSPSNATTATSNSASTQSSVTRRQTIRQKQPQNYAQQHPVSSRASLSKIPVNNEEESTEEEDVDSDNQITVLCCIVQQSLDGWVLKSIGKITDALNEMDQAPKRLYMELIGGRNLINSNQQQQPLDFYVKLKMNEKKKRLLKSKQRAKSRVQQKSTNPTWNEKFEFNIYHPDDCLEIKLVIEDGKKFYLEGTSHIFVKDALAFEGQVKELELRLLDKSGFVVQQEQGQPQQNQPILTVKFSKE